MYYGNNMYPAYGQPFIQSNICGWQYPSYQNIPDSILGLIRSAVAGEREDELFYDYLISSAPSAEDKEIIESIRNDERKHNRMFRQLYYELTGEMLPPAMESDFQMPASYTDGIKKALFGELAAVEKYRKILFALGNRRHINMLTEVITDELRHGSKYNYLFTKASK